MTTEIGTGARARARARAGVLTVKKMVVKVMMVLLHMPFLQLFLLN
jgi:hypothetical protein